MSYISNNDIETRVGSAAYVQLTDDAGTGLPDTSVVDEARAGALGEVDAYLARRYAVPVDLTKHAELAGLLRSITLDLAEHRLRLRRPPVPEESKARRSAALILLKRIANAEIDLPAATAPSPAALRGLDAETSGDERTFTHDELSSF